MLNRTGETLLWNGEHPDAEVLSGKPVVVGARLPVESLLRLFAAGWTGAQVLRNHPNLKPEDLRAIFAYAAEAARE